MDAWVNQRCYGHDGQADLRRGDAGRFVGTVQAGVLAPSKPSSLVALVSLSAAASAATRWIRGLPDGSAVPFAIPPKFVLTGIEWVFVVTTGQGGLVICCSSHQHRLSAIRSFRPGRAPGNGIGRGSALIPDVVAGPGVDICADVPLGASSGVARVPGQKQMAPARSVGRYGLMIPRPIVVGRAPPAAMARDWSSRQAQGLTPLP